jgi:LDH2 family malate/lactate/ureidoglycolate dehydrogenase
VAPAKAAGLASHLLWFDEAGIPSHGVASLPDLLDRIDTGQVDPKTEGKVGQERNGTAVFDARHGIPLLGLEHAAGIAIEKARDAGVGLVAVRNLGSAGPAASIAAEMAIGPTAALIAGPDASWAVALPSPEGLPAVFDTTLASGPAPAPMSHHAELEAFVTPWASVLAPRESWLILAISVPAFESLSTFHSRVAAAIENLAEGSGRLLPAAWEARRHEARSSGVVITPEGWKPLKRWAERLGVELPNPSSH